MTQTIKMKLRISIQSISDLITNSSSESFVIYTKEGIKAFKEIISSLIGEDFNNRFNLHLVYSDWAYDEYEDLPNKDLSFEDWCFEQGWEYYRAPVIRGIEIIAKDPKYLSQAINLNKIYTLFEAQERYC